jgi:hypothetical protein
MRRSWAYSLLASLVLITQTFVSSPARAAPANPTSTIDLNFVFLHGAGGTDCDLQLLADTFEQQLPSYILNFQQDNPSKTVKFDFLQRCYPSDVDLVTWANNISSGINNHFANKQNLILIAHSMAGKAALYAIAHDIGGLAEKVKLLVTIDSPVKSLESYMAAGGTSVMDFCRARWLTSDKGLCNSVTYYDSTDDGTAVTQVANWLALIAGENAPASPKFDFGGVDTYPGDMDDGIVPISAQYADSADVVYYGEHGHSEFATNPDTARTITGEVMYYIFGGNMECSVFENKGSVSHKADWMLGTDYWQDQVGELPAMNGQVWHWNDSYTESMEWEDVVSYQTLDNFDKRSSFTFEKVRSSELFTSVEEARWYNPNDPTDYRLYLKTKAAPRNYIQVDWNVYKQGLVPADVERDHYEVDVTAGTPLSKIRGSAWASDDPRDLRLNLWTQAESPFQWFEAEWRVYTKELRYRKIIDEIPPSS